MSTSACGLVFVRGELVGVSWSWGEMTGYRRDLQGHSSFNKRACWQCLGRFFCVGLTLRRRRRLEPWPERAIKWPTDWRVATVIRHASRRRIGHTHHQHQQQRSIAFTPSLSSLRQFPIFSSQNVLSLSPVSLRGTLYLQLSHSRVTLLFLNANLNVTCFVLFLVNNFLRFTVTIVMRYCTLFYVVISVR